ncbi:ABC transporter substrate-binding protein [Paenibacillus eucommiae]|uniref:N-acetylglucosamine transport system substrate-binding protein n=1 Tax=Paenibacillus eucommiae TaxID=1355755 RepID=A0ABS4IT22_9BACL|nr:ABC transporter substrate-binding protein [Paenibacillus eucommiae]MBP1990714.1 N-acetylglucosamine transport system substrate-binding protein [Paenibacillus eucommiae]
MRVSSRNWMAKIFIVMLAFAMVVGCSSGGKDTTTPAPSDNSGTPAPSDAAGDVYENGLSKTEKVKIRWGYWENGYGRAWADNAVAKFTEKYPNVSFEITASPVIRDLIGTKIAAKNDEDMFDIVSPSFNGDEGTIAQQAGMFEELTDLWEREVPDAPGKKLKDVVLDNTVEYSAKVDGKFYQIPMGAGTLGLFYDKAFFKEHGWNEAPKTYSEFLALLEDIKADGIIPITYPGVYPTYVHFALTMKPFELAQQQGNLEAFTKDFRAGVNMYSAPEVKEMWTRLYDMGKKGYFPEGAAALNHTQSQMQLLQHKAALAATGDWVENEMLDSIPDGFEWGFMAIPFSEKAGEEIWVENVIGSGSLMIWKNKPELMKSWAKEFALFLMTNDIQAVNGASGIAPIRKDFADNAENLTKLQKAPQAVLEYVKNNNGRFGSGVRDVTFSEPDAAKATKLVTEMIVEVTAGKKDPLPVLEEADKLMKKVLEGKK